MRCPYSLSLALSVSLIVISSGGALLAAEKDAKSLLAPTPQRVKEIAEMLSPEPTGVGPAPTDRETWTAIGKTDPFKKVIPDAEENLTAPLPTVTLEDFDSYEKTGRRERYSRALRSLTARYRRAVYAECIENRGRFVSDIERTVEQLCKMPTWVPPHHNGVWERDKDTTFVVDLVSSDIAAMLSTADFWLGEKISERTRQLVRRELNRRIFHPVRNKIEGGDGRRIWWLTGTNNWNSVCMGNVVIAAQAILADRDERAYFIAAAENVIKHYLKGFSEDGYCSEGLGYWNYGFSYYVMLADAVFQATGGKLDWMDDALVKKVALFGTRMEILPRIYPSVADASLRVRPGAYLQNYINRKYRLGLDRWSRPLGPAGMRVRSMQQSIFAFPHGLAAKLSGSKYVLDPKREWFDDAQFYIGRPGGADSLLGVACKGGHNAEHHNHNDVGTYMVALGSERPLVDPGAPVYTKDTFSDRRYEDKVINSWGHPVPLVAGKFQRTGSDAKATLVRKEFTDTRDTLVLDITRAYHPPTLPKSLTRTIVYDRGGHGSLSVTDKVEFPDAQKFGTALISYGDLRRNDDGSLLITMGDESVVVTIETGSVPYEIHEERIKSEVRARRKPRRIGIDLAQPVTSARITVRIAPAAEQG